MNILYENKVLGVPRIRQVSGPVEKILVTDESVCTK